MKRNLPVLRSDPVRKNAGIFVTEFGGDGVAQVLLAAQNFSKITDVVPDAVNDILPQRQKHQLRRFVPVLAPDHQFTDHRVKIAFNLGRGCYPCVDADPVERWLPVKCHLSRAWLKIVGGIFSVDPAFDGMAGK